jgi:hypothetical protein
VTVAGEMGALVEDHDMAASVQCEFACDYRAGKPRAHHRKSLLSHARASVGGSAGEIQPATKSDPVAAWPI